MKALIWADLHGHTYKEFATLEDGVNTRLWNQLNVIGAVRESARENEVDEIWYLGDLCQLKNNHDIMVLYALTEAFKSLADEWKILMLPGNHDYRMWSSQPLFLEMISQFQNRIHVLAQGWEERVSKFPGHIYAEPFDRKTISLSIRLKDLEPKKNAIFLGHQDIVGNKYGGKSVIKGLDPTILDKKFDWSFIGHYHKPGKHGKNIISVGAPLQHTFSDAAKTNFDSNFEPTARRGWWVFDSDKNEAKFIPNKMSPEFIDYVYDPNAKEKGFIPGDWEKDFYRIEVVGNHSLPERLRRIKWKRVSYRWLPEQKKRVKGGMTFSTAKKELIEKYVEYRLGKTAKNTIEREQLIALGEKYL